MLRRRLALLLPLVLVSACDKRTDEELRTMIEEVADAKVKPALEAKESLEKDLAARQQDLDEHKRRITSLESQFADLSAQTVGLEANLADAQKRLDTLESKLDKPTPPSPSLAGRPDPAAYYRVTIGDAQSIGPDDALVTIVTWSDFQCPFCGRVSPTIDELRRDYGADLRYVFKHNPLGFHKDARPAAIAAEAAGEQGKFWEMHDKLFANSRDLTRENFVKWAKELKLDVKRFERDMDSSAIAARVDAQQSEGMKLGARGTPAFFINGRFLSGAQPAASFKVLIDEELGKARAKVAAGTPRSGVYEATIAGGKTEP